MPGKPISEVLRARIATLYEEGAAYLYIKASLKIPLGTISRAINLYRQMNTFSFPNKRSRRPRCTSGRTDNAIVIAAKCDPFASSSKIKIQITAAVENKNVRTRTIRRRLVEHMLCLCRLSQKPILSSKNIRGRKAFCAKFNGNILWLLTKLSFYSKLRSFYICASLQIHNSMSYTPTNCH